MIKFTWNEKHLDYEIETSLKIKNRTAQTHAKLLLKWKASRLRDWNRNDNRTVSCCRKFRSSAWNEKHLDYEIETNATGFTPSKETETEVTLKWKASRLRDWNFDVLHPHGGLSYSDIPWNEKHLDYEIETLRLKSVCTSKPAEVTWNEKHLDYEIETVGQVLSVTPVSFLPTWNEKHLDYEIETLSSCMRV